MAEAAAQPVAAEEGAEDAWDAWDAERRVAAACGSEDKAARGEMRCDAATRGVSGSSCGGCAGLSPRSSLEPETVTRVAPPVGPLAGVALETIGIAWKAKPPPPEENCWPLVESSRVVSASATCGERAG